MGASPGGPDHVGSPGEGGSPDPPDPAGAPVRLRLAGRRADVVLTDPDRHNPQTPALWRALSRLGRWLEGRVDVVVLRGEGPSFSAGLDRAVLSPQSPDGLAHLARLSEQDAEDEIAAFQEAFAIWSDCGYVTIAAVQGHAIGAGFQLALAADLRVAADDVAFEMREPRLGLVPDLGGTARLVDAVGYARALDICASGRTVDAQEALACGLVARVVPPGDLEQAVDDLAAPFLGPAAPAVLATRELLRRAAGAHPGGHPGGTERLADQLAAERAAQVVRIRALAAALGAPHGKSSHGKSRAP